LSINPVVSALELDALLAKPNPGGVKIDKYFPLRLWFVVLVSGLWFIRLTFFTNLVATELFTNPAVRDYMMPALYFRAWVLFAFVSAGIWSYVNSKYHAITFALLLVASVFNLVFDLSIFYAERLTMQDPKTTFFILVRVILSYMLYVSMRNSYRMPQGRDKWNIFLPFKKS
jgi:hypothetical protein